MGAQVIKIEKREGDDARKWGPPFWEGAAASFQTLNRSKRSAVCDLRSSRDRDTARSGLMEPSPPPNGLSLTKVPRPVSPVIRPRSAAIA